MTQIRIIVRTAVAVGGFLVALPAVPASAQPQGYRASESDVSPAAMFGAAYQRAGRPRIVVFWNRELSDSVSTEYDEVTHFSGNSDSSVTALGNRVSGNQSADAQVTTGIHRSEQGRDSELSERGDWRVESIFASDLVDAGVDLIDRATIVRITGKDIRQLFSNQQSNEAKALIGHAEILLEVLQTSDPDAPLGTAFKVSAKDIRSGRILAQFVTSAAPPQRKARWVIGDSGFVKETLPAANDRSVGHQLSNETLRALTRALARR